MDGYGFYIIEIGKADDFLRVAHEAQGALVGI